MRASRCTLEVRNEAYRACPFRDACRGGADVVYAPVWVAARAGIFRKHGLNVDMQYQASSVQIPSIISGDVKLALVGCTAVAAANAAGADLVILANIATIQPYLMMVPAAIKKPADLVGKVIGIVNSAIRPMRFRGSRSYLTDVAAGPR